MYADTLALANRMTATTPVMVRNGLFRAKSDFFKRKSTQSVEFTSFGKRMGAAGLKPAFRSISRFSPPTNRVGGCASTRGSEASLSISQTGFASGRRSVHARRRVLLTKRLASSLVFPVALSSRRRSPRTHRLTHVALLQTNYPSLQLPTRDLRC